MTIRNARNYTMAMARESVWNTPPVGRYAALRLSGETLHLVQQRRGQALLNDAGIVPPDRVVRSHVEGRISTPADTGAIQQWMTLITGNQWASELSKRVLTVAAAETPPSLTLVRTLDGTPQHRAFFSGVKVQRLQLAPAADQTFMLQASLVGASQDKTTLIRPATPAAPAMPMALGAEVDRFELRLDDANPRPRPRPRNGHDTRRVLQPRLAGISLTLTRAGMAPHFRLGATQPAVILPGRLVLAIEMQCLADDAGLGIPDAGATMAGATMDVRVVLSDGAAQMRFRIYKMRVHRRDTLLASPTAPAIIAVNGVAELTSEGLFRIEASG